jgi:hypothetical protein
MAAIVLGCVVFPLCAVPLYLLGSYVADALDNDDSNGVFELGLLLGVGVPGLAALWVARLVAVWKWLPALGLGIVSGFLSVVTLLAALLIFVPDFGE